MVFVYFTAAKTRNKTFPDAAFVPARKQLIFMVKPIIEIADNGKGIDKEDRRDFGNGLLNMKSRMESVRGKFEIISEKNTGTKITLKGKLNYPGS